MQKFSKFQSFYSQKQTNFTNNTPQENNDKNLDQDNEELYFDNSIEENQENTTTTANENSSSENDTINSSPISLKAREMLKCAEAHKNAVMHILKNN